MTPPTHHSALAQLLAHPIVTTALPGRGPHTYREHATLGELRADLVPF